MADDPTGAPQIRNGPGSGDPGPPDYQKALAKASAPNPTREAEVMPSVRHDDDERVDVGADALRSAAELIASRGELERQAYERGVLFGYAQGWDQRGEAERERRWAA